MSWQLADHDAGRCTVAVQRHLEAVLREYCLHYNDERPHQSRNLRPPQDQAYELEHSRERLGRPGSQRQTPRRIVRLIRPPTGVGGSPRHGLLSNYQVVAA
ncbi:MAG TPA: hypothetical protein VGK54_08030 [Chloroflexota bacterium]